MKKIAAILSLMVLLVAGVYSQSSMAKSTADDYTPAIWKIEYKGKTSYLFGSIHFGEKDMFPLPKKVMDAFASSDTLAVEIDMNQSAMQEIAQYTNSVAVDMENQLSTVLTEKTKKRYDDYCLAQKLACQNFEYFEPWFLFLNFTSMTAMKAGLDPNLGIDKFFLDNARSKKEIVALESVKSQIDMLDGFSKPLQDSLLFGVMAPIDMKAELKKLATAWKQGKIEEVFDESFDEMMEGEEALPKAQMDEYINKFLYERNQVMADGIAAQITAGKSVFAVVGAMHYAGKNSVNQYLEEKGFKVERL